MHISLIDADAVDLYVSGLRVEVTVFNSESLQASKTNRKMMGEQYLVAMWYDIHRDTWNPSMTNSIIWWTIGEHGLLQLHRNRAVKVCAKAQ